MGILSFIWHAGRDSNPQPSEPESDALSIEPPAHLLESLNIIPSFYLFVKGNSEIFRRQHPFALRKQLFSTAYCAIIFKNVHTPKGGTNHGTADFPHLPQRFQP